MTPNKALEIFLSYCEECGQKLIDNRTNLHNRETAIVYIKGYTAYIELEGRILCQRCLIKTLEEKYSNICEIGIRLAPYFV